LPLSLHLISKPAFRCRTAQRVTVRAVTCRGLVVGRGGDVCTGCFRRIGGSLRSVGAPRHMRQQCWYREVPVPARIRVATRARHCTEAPRAE
jgi:hypothetical protein